MRLTMDLDLAISLSDENIKKLVQSLTDTRYVPRLPILLQDFADPAVRKDWIDNKGMKALNLWKPPDPFSSLDIMIDIPVSFQELLAESEKMSLDDTDVLVASINHLILMKEKAGRDTDKADMIALKEIQRIRDEK